MQAVPEKSRPWFRRKASWTAAGLETAGVEFIDENGGGPGVRLKKSTKGKGGK